MMDWNSADESDGGAFGCGIRRMYEEKEGQPQKGWPNKIQASYACVSTRS